MTVEPSRTPAVPSPTRVGQATAIEQSRAAAEVHARVVVAQQVPRRIDVAEREMAASCAMPALAEKAFYRYQRSGGSVTGESIHLARELARCWGNVDYGISELRRDDEAGQSEMLAWAWDLQTNTRNGQVFIVPHARDTKLGRKPLVDLRDVYENNANMGARRVREAVFAILPPWFVEAAKEACHATLKRGDGSPIAERVAVCLAKFAEMGIRDAQLVRKVGRPTTAWTELDLAQLTVSLRSIQRGEITAGEEFGTDQVTAAEIRAQGDAGKSLPVSASEPVEKQEDPPAPPDEEPPAQTLINTEDGPEVWPATAQPPDAKTTKRGGSRG